MARTKRYKCEDGSYLTLEGGDGTWHVAWYCADIEDVGAYVGDTATVPDEPPKEKSTWEMWVAHRAIAPLADGRSSAYGFFFESEKKARLALSAANEALRNGGAPWPEWAIQAKEAGWTPPKNWKP